MKHYSLVHQTDRHYILHDARDKKVFHVAKGGLDEDTHSQIRNMHTKALTLSSDENMRILTHTNMHTPTHTYEYVHTMRYAHTNTDKRTQTITFRNAHTDIQRSILQLISEYT